jgi:hypothetical protein
MCALKDANGKTHYLVKDDITKNPSGRLRCKSKNARSVSRTISEEMLAFTVLAAERISTAAAKLMAEIVSKLMLNTSGIKHDTVVTRLNCYL